MPCFVALIALMAPRFALLLVFLFSDYVYQATGSILWNILGFLFMPLTLLAYAFAVNQGGGLSGIYLVVVIIAALVDLGLIGGGAKSGAGMKKRG